jgi:hypothetical protein
MKKIDIFTSQLAKEHSTPTKIFLPIAVYVTGKAELFKILQIHAKNGVFLLKLNVNALYQSRFFLYRFSCRILFYIAFFMDVYSIYCRNDA